MRRVLPALLLGTATAWACSVPVFRYALERWPADHFEAVVFHDGPLTPAQAGLVQNLARGGDPSRPAANLTVRTAARAATADTALRELWQRLPPGTTLPAIALRPPAATRQAALLWHGALTPENARGLHTSAARRELVQRLLRGDSAVWVLVESGKETLDTAAARQLDAQLRVLERELRLPELNPADLQPTVAASAPDLAVRFSLLRVARDDPAEAVLVALLLHTEDDLAASRVPIAFPIFGRGRALYALVGAGINAEMIGEACRFVVGACSCVIKEENPGMDLLLAAEWDALVTPLIKDEPAPPLSGLAGFAAATPAGATRGVAAARETTPPAGIDSRPGGPEAPGVANTLIRRLGLLGGVAGGILLAASWWLFQHRGR